MSVLRRPHSRHRRGHCWSVELRRRRLFAEPADPALPEDRSVRARRRVASRGWPRLFRRRTPMGTVGAVWARAGGRAWPSVSSGRPPRRRCSREGRRRVRRSCSSISRPPASAAAPARRRSWSAARWFEAVGRFATRQFVLTRYTDERPLLETVTGELGPRRRARQLQRQVVRRPGARDTLSLSSAGVDRRAAAARRRPASRAAVLETTGRRTRVQDRERGPDHAVRALVESCSLIALEQHIIGAGRVGDVPGFEIPGRYFQFVRSGDAGPLAAVLEHNRLDLLSLAALTARLLHLVQEGPESTRATAREAIALGRVYERAGFDDRACEAFERALEMGGAPPTRRSTHRCPRAGARAAPVTRRYDEAAACWRRLLDVRGCPPPSCARPPRRSRSITSTACAIWRRRERLRYEVWRRGCRRAGEPVQRRLARMERKLESLIV